ncbi:MAG: CCA tRNA nucleotidyltransferase [Chloroflexota bacterium]
MASTTLQTDELLLEKAHALAAVFAAAGRQLYLVGGSVRDTLLGRPVHDLDLTTDAPPDEIKRLARRVRPDAVYDVGAKFGTIGLVFRSPAGEAAAAEPAEDRIEITTFRSEQYLDGSRKPEVSFGTSLDEDLARRDFTMNAIAQHLSTGALHDPYGGAADVDRKVIRAVGDPLERFREDPLRLLRAVRFAAQLGFRIDPETSEAIRASAPALERISRERIQEELSRILVSPRPSAGIRQATELGLMAYAIPEVLPMRGVSQRPLHHKDVFEHTMGVVENIPPELGLRWAALLHDIGKPRTKSMHDGAVHFFGHEDIGERMARQILRRLHFDHRFVERVCKLVRMHLRVNSYDREWTDSAVRRLLREAGEELDDLIHLSRADVTSYRQERVLAANMRADEFERRCRELLEREDVAKLQSPLDGNDLMQLFGKSPGPWIKPIKDYLLDLVLEGDLAQDNKATATTLARRYVEEHGLD